MLYRLHLAMSTTLMMIGTYCIGICKSNYHTIRTTTNPLLLDIDSESRLRTKLYDKGEHFPIVNFPCICSNISAAPAYGVYHISQVIRYTRASG